MPRSYLSRRRPKPAQPAPYTPAQLADLYGFPKVQGGAVPTVAILEMGGGYRPADVQAATAKWGLPMPNIVDANCGASNAPTGDPDGPDGEVMADLEIVAAVMAHCTGRPANVLMIWVPNAAGAFVTAAQAAQAHPSKPVALSCSWGGPEDSYQPSEITATDAALEALTAAGCTFTAAAGDGGSGDGERRGVHADYPAFSSYALNCGGTSIQSANGVITRETVWNDGTRGGASGGGYSAVEPLPSYQQGIVTGQFRGGPDVCANADEENSPWEILTDGVWGGSGGTSMVAPFIASLVALGAMQAGRGLGLVNDVLYQHPGAFRDVTAGSDGKYAAGPGWDPASGLGAPMGAAVFAALTGGPSLATRGRRRAA